MEPETEGYGKCTDCVWLEVKGGCNVSRDSELCILNKKKILLQERSMKERKENISNLLGNFKYKKEESNGN